MNLNALLVTKKLIYKIICTNRLKSSTLEYMEPAAT